ncbi:MAG: DSD1 family PLP-dependent enzyme [bacterium]|nr:DSD1 family PLP-dependent enzyme [bacterium]
MKREDIDTPALLLDLDRVGRNIKSMASFFAGRDASLRPHFKSPKCAEVVKLQLEAGAIGITCAKLGEAESIADAGIRTSILIANQIVGPIKSKRAVTLAARVPELIVAVDSAQQVEALDAALKDAGGEVRLGALIEVDSGMHRCGTETAEQTVELARRIVASALEYRGIMGYEGHAVLIPDAAKRKELAEAATTSLLEHRQALVEAGLEPEIVSAGGTGTHDLTGSSPGVTEIQAGSYVFMDGAYGKVRKEFEPALTIVTTIIHRRGRLLVTDCGVKALSQDFGMPEGATLPLRCVGLSEEHGHILIDEGEELDLQPGDRIELLPSHSDTTINLHERYYALRGDDVEAVWPIIGRGKFV